MARRAENVSGYTRNHNTLIIVSRVFAGMGWLFATAGIAVCVLSWSAVSLAIGTVASDGLGADVGLVAATASPFLTGLLMIFSGMMIVAYGQIMRVVSSIEANTQAAFLILDRRMPNPHPEIDSLPGMNDSGLSHIPM